MLDSGRVSTYTLLLCSLCFPAASRAATNAARPFASFFLLRSGMVIKTRVAQVVPRHRKGGPNFSLLPILCRNLIKAATRSATSFRGSADGPVAFIISCLYYRHCRAITNRLMLEEVIRRRRPCKNTALSRRYYLLLFALESRTLRILVVADSRLFKK